MRQEQETLGFAYNNRSRRRFDALLLSAFLCSLLLHGAFLLVSRDWLINSARDMEQQLEALFKVSLDQLQASDFISRPTSQEYLQTRERALEHDLTAMEQLPQRAAESEIQGLNPERGNEPPPQWRDKSGSRYIDDQPARDLITSDMSRDVVDDFLSQRDRQTVRDTASAPQRTAILGRGGGTGGRLLAGLPPPSLDAEPTVSRVAQSDLAPRIEPPMPDIGAAAEPPVVLPPVTELLPSPDLMRSSPRPASIRAEEEALQALGDRFVQLDDLLDVQLSTYRHVGGDGYFMIRIRAHSADDRLRVLPKDVVFAVDASRSMGDRRMRAIRNEISSLLRRLRPEDRFNIVGFRRQADRFVEMLSPVNEQTLREADRFLQTLDSSGFTDIYQSLEPLVQLGVERARPLILILYSDGRPTVGVVNSRRIINQLTQYRGPSSSIFCVGAGSVINSYLLDMLAFLNRGMVAFADVREDIAPASRAIFGYIQDPLLLRVQADFSDVDAREVFPKQLPELFLHGELRLWGRLGRQDAITVRLVGEAFDEQKEMIKTIPIPARDNASFDLAREWAYHKIYHLVGQIVEEGEQASLLDEIQRISRTYNVVTPYSDVIAP